MAEHNLDEDGLIVRAANQLEELQGDEELEEPAGSPADDYAPTATTFTSAGRGQRGRLWKEPTAIQRLRMVIPASEPTRRAHEPSGLGTGGKRERERPPDKPEPAKPNPSCPDKQVSWVTSPERYGKTFSSGATWKKLTTLRHCSESPMSQSLWISCWIRRK